MGQHVATGLKGRAEQALRQHRATLIQLSHEIHADPEVSWEEHRAAARVARLMESAGFHVTTGAYGVETAVEAILGEGDLTVAICAEYDALPAIGHACGHNVIAAAGVGAALALAPLAAEAGLRVKLLGTPAEEHGGGKVTMLSAGAWDDVDLSLMVHGFSGPDRVADALQFCAVDRFAVSFTGVSSHAGVAPEQGVNAGAAATIALTAIALQRQHLPRDCNLNAFVSEGGDATNIIPGRSVVQVEVRAYELEVLQLVKRRVLACFEGAAIATGCTWKHERTEPVYAPVSYDRTLTRLWNANLERLGRTLDPATVWGGGSTDMGNVSQLVPSIHPLISVCEQELPLHSADFASAAMKASADRAILDGAAAIAATVLDVATDPVLRGRFRDAARRRARPSPASAFG